MSWIETYSGKQVDLLNPDPTQFTLEDIFHSLAQVPRFGGHAEHHYSVAAHSLNVAKLVPVRLKFQAIMHDATEAYLGDMPTPFKAVLKDYREAEDRLWWAICKAFELPYKLDPLIKEADRIALMTERDILKPDRNFDWGPELENTIRVPHNAFVWAGYAPATYVEKAREYRHLQ